ncbi:tyrosine-type recombinase/integrase [Desulforudis sp. 1088]|uniref:tyrosine-type recombinase/integrase n=1 Tax=unclassified Candidatus Desulforudis TaxID=2635950 RepID=UPI003CE59554
MTYKTLTDQLDRLHKHSRQNSIGTKHRYYSGMRRFLRFVADEFKLQKIANIADKHLIAYVNHLKMKGCKPGYICTELCAIRYYHDQVDVCRPLTVKNAQLGVEPRQKIGNRAWTEEELAEIIAAALDAGKPWVADALILSRQLGLRIHEVVRLDRADAERVLRENELRVKGKGGLVRHIPLTKEAAAALSRSKQRVPRGAKLFVPPDRKGHQVIKEIQDFIRQHRQPRPIQLTFHGLRYTDAQENYNECLAAGKTKEDAEKETARRLGHRRPRVTRTYVGPF